LGSRCLAEIVGRFSGGVCIDIENGNSGAQFRECAGSCLANSHGSAGNDNDFIPEADVHASASF
jgi:hypothetical protein